MRRRLRRRCGGSTLVTKKITIVTIMVTTIAPDLGRVLLGKTRGGILALLFDAPDEAMHVRRIARLAGLGLGPTQRELKLLASIGLLKRREIGRQVWYTADPSSPVYGELRGLVLKTVGVVRVLREALRPMAPQIRVAFLFGSFAQGRQKSASDVDLFIIGDVSFTAIARSLVESQRQLKREINPT